MGMLWQLKRIDSWKEAVSIAVTEGPRDDIAVPSFSATVDENLLQECVTYLAIEQPREDDTASLKSLLSAASKSDRGVAMLCRRGGYKKSMDDIDDFTKVANALLISKSEVMDKAQEALKAGHSACISTGSTEAWKDVWRQQMANWRDVQFVREIEASHDIMNAMMALGQTSAEKKQLLADSLNSKLIKPGRTLSVLESQSLFLKRKLKEMEDADMIDQDTVRSATIKIEAGSGNLPRRRRVRARRAAGGEHEKYKRKAGDELRIAKKREIVPLHHVHSVLLCRSVTIFLLGV